MAEDDRHSLGERVRTAFPEQCYLVGFATEKGTVTAAPGWNESAQIMQVPASHAGSFEHLFSMATEDNFMLPMRTIRNRKLKESLSEEHGQRAIGVSYDPANEMEKHYVGARLAEQFDELIWFHRTSALRVKP
jgi:erythromycin esterase-like protein